MQLLYQCMSLLFSSQLVDFETKLRLDRCPRQAADNQQCCALAVVFRSCRLPFTHRCSTFESNRAGFSAGRRPHDAPWLPLPGCLFFDGGIPRLRFQELLKTPPSFVCDTSNGVHRLAGLLLARLSGLGPVGLSLLQRHVPECLGSSRAGASRAWAVAGCGSPNSSSLVAASQWFHPPAGPERLQQGSCHSLPCGRGAVAGGTQQQCRGGGSATQDRWVIKLACTASLLQFLHATGDSSSSVCHEVPACCRQCVHCCLSAARSMHALGHCGV
jgi:hypothetical protein